MRDLVHTTVFLTIVAIIVVCSGMFVLVDWLWD